MTDIEALKKEVPKQFKGPFHDQLNPLFSEAKGWNACIDYLASTNRLVTPTQDRTEALEIIKAALKDFDSDGEVRWDSIDAMRNLIGEENE